MIIYYYYQHHCYGLPSFISFIGIGNGPDVVGCLLRHQFLVDNSDDLSLSLSRQRGGITLEWIYSL